MNRRRLQRISITARGKNTAVEIGPAVTVIHGANGSGKTTLVGMAGMCMTGAFEPEGAPARTSRHIIGALWDGGGPVRVTLSFSDGNATRSFSPALDSAGVVAKVTGHHDNTLSAPLPAFCTTSEITNVASASPKVRRQWIAELARMMGLVPEAVPEIPDVLKVDTDGQDALDVVEAALARARSRVDDARQGADASRAVLAHTAATAADAGASPRPLGEIEAELDEVKKEIDSLRVQEDDARRGGREIDAITARLETIDSLELERADLLVRHEEARATVEAATAAVKAAEGDLVSANQAAADDYDRHLTLDRDIKSQERELTRQIDQGAGRLESLRLGKNEGSCPVCGAHEGAAPALAAGSGVFRRVPLPALYREAEEERDGLQATLDECRARSREQTKAADRARRLTIDARESANAELTAAKVAYSKAAGARTAHAGRLEAIAAAIGEDTVEGLRRRLSAVCTADVVILKMSTDGATAQLDALSDELASQTVFVDRAKAQAAARAALDDATARLDEARWVFANIAALAAGVGQAAFDRVSGVINASITELGGWVDALKFVADYSDGFVGVERGGVRIGLRHLSAGEKVAVFAVLQVAAQPATGWRNIVVDGADCLDDHRFVGFVKSLEGLISDGRLDQAIVTTARMSPKERSALKRRPGVSLVEL